MVYCGFCSGVYIFGGSGFVRLVLYAICGVCCVYLLTLGGLVYSVLRVSWFIVWDLSCGL